MPTQTHIRWGRIFDLILCATLTALAIGFLLFSIFADVSSVERGLSFFGWLVFCALAVTCGSEWMEEVG